MGKILIIAEKHDMANKIALALINKEKISISGFLETDQFIFSYALGHLYKLSYPAENDEKYKFWDIKNLPFKFESIKLELIENESSKKQALIIKKLLSNQNICEIINACDADREGENIFRNIVLGSKVKFNPNMKFSRMWISSTTKEGIIDAFKNRKDLKEYKNLAISAKGRAYADYHLGLNATMAMTSSFKKSSKDIITVGRVQTPTLKIIVDRENDIKNFKSKKLYAIKGKFIGNNNKEFIADYVPEGKEEKNEYENLDEVKEKISLIETGEYNVNDIKKTQKNISHKPLFALSDLQIAMSSKYGYSAQLVLSTVQSLYEKYSLVTYPRTDEQHISPEWAKKCNSYVLNSLVDVFSTFVNEIKDNDYKIDSKCIASKDKIGAHEALTPTGKKLTVQEYQSLNDVERNVYNAIVFRFLTAFLPDAIDETTTYQFFNGTTTFKYSYTKEIKPGFRIIEKPLEDENKTIELILEKDDLVELLEAYPKEKDTQPPKRFTEGTLIKEMKNPSKYLKDKNDKDMIKKVEGIGTEATRAGIIESLKKHNYITVEKKQIIPTQKGIDFINVFPSDILKSISLTVELERKLEEIAIGFLSFENFIQYIFKLDDKLIEDIKNSSKNSENKIASGDAKILCKCPFCGSNIIEKDSLYCCENKECNTVIFKNQLYKSLGLYSISSKNAIELFENGKTSKKVSGFRSKNKKRYSAFLTYKKENNKNKVWISFE